MDLDYLRARTARPCASRWSRRGRNKPESFRHLRMGLIDETMPTYPLPDHLRLTEQQLKDQVVGKIPDALWCRYMRQRHIEIKPQPRDPIHPQPMTPPKPTHRLSALRRPPLRGGLRAALRQRDGPGDGGRSPKTPRPAGPPDAQCGQVFSRMRSWFERNF